MRVITLSVLLFLMLYLPLYAHKITTFAYVEDGKVFTETYFSDGTRAKNADVKVYDAKSGRLLLRGKTNKAGEFIFKIPHFSDGLKIVVEAELGHRATYILKSDELGQIGLKKKSKSEDLYLAKSKKVEIRYEEIRKIIDEELSKNLKPLYKTLCRMEEDISKPSLKDVFAGIGYIVGMFGVLFFILAKREHKD